MIPPLLAAILPCREPGELPGARLGWPRLSIAHRHAGVPGAGGDPHIPLALPMAAHLQQHIWVQDTSGEPGHPLPGHLLPPPSTNHWIWGAAGPGSSPGTEPRVRWGCGEPPPPRQRGRQCRRGGTDGVPGSPGPANPQSSFAHRPSQEVPAWCHEAGDSDSEEAWHVAPVGIAPAPSLQHTAEPPAQGRPGVLWGQARPALAWHNGCSV